MAYSTVALQQAGLTELLSGEERSSSAGRTQCECRE